MLDRFNRKIDYLRVSVTDRCNHKCIYCTPGNRAILETRRDILSYEQIETIVRESVALGVKKVRLTGGEPLIRRDVERLVEKLSRCEGLSELCMTTNGVYLLDKARNLKSAGLDRVNVSIDSLDPDRYREITRGGELQKALEGIDRALEAGLVPVKINMVVLEDTTENEVEKMQRFCVEKGLDLQRIMRFSLYDRDDLSLRFRTERPPKCAQCNRLRLTSDGFLKPCLFSEHEVKVDLGNIRQSILRAVDAKPRRGSACRTRSMAEIGG